MSPDPLEVSRIDGVPLAMGRPAYGKDDEGTQAQERVCPEGKLAQFSPGPVQVFDVFLRSIKFGSLWRRLLDLSRRVVVGVRGYPRKPHDQTQSS